MKRITTPLLLFLCSSLYITACGVSVASTKQGRCDDSFEPSCDGPHKRWVCEGGLVTQSPCAAGCVAGRCCEVYPHATQDGVDDDRCTYACAEGYTNHGSATTPNCQPPAACTTDVCDGARIQICDPSSGALSEAQDCPSGACVDGACCPSFAHAAGAQKDGRCVYTCDDGYWNHRNRLKPQCETCPPQKDAIGEPYGAGCRYTCTPDFKNYGSDTETNCLQRTVCEGGMIRTRADSGALGEARYCSSQMQGPDFCFQRSHRHAGSCLKDFEERDYLTFQMEWRVKAQQKVSFQVKNIGPPFPTYAYKCRDGDPWSALVLTHTLPEPHHCNYETDRVVTISIRGYIHGLEIGREDDCGEGAQLIAIKNWGLTPWRTLAGMFKGCEHLTSLPAEGPVLTAVDSLDEMFSGATQLNQNLLGWDTAGIKSMTRMFAGATTFNGDIGDWDVSGVTDMRSMFKGAAAFDQDLRGWDVSNVTVHNEMFEGCPIRERNKPDLK